MVKHGPCCHCGIEKTPLWRNGPPEKPILCNACGSRWRIRGTLEDYIPKHALAVMTNHARDRTQNPHQQKLPLERRLVSHPNITVHNESHSNNKENAIRYDDPYSTGLGDNTSHRSSSGSSSISCSDHSHTELLSSIHYNNWNSNVPSRKRSVVQYRNLTFVEKLQKDLYEILQNEEPTTLSECPDGNLIYYENDGNPEIGLGVLLLKPPPITSSRQEFKTFKSEDDISPSDPAVRIF